MRPTSLHFAVKENAAEACTTACQDEQSAGLALAAGQGGDKDAENARMKEAFESCYTKCVAQETKDVAEERQKVSEFTAMGCPTLPSECCTVHFWAWLWAERLPCIADRTCQPCTPAILQWKAPSRRGCLRQLAPQERQQGLCLTALTARHALLLLCSAEPGLICSSRRLRRTLRRWWRGRRSSLATRPGC